MNKSLQHLQLNLPLGSLDAYIAYVNQIPMLTQQEEQAYAEKLHTNKDLNAAKALILAHLKYVVKVAKGYMGYGLPLNDLIQEGNIGLMKAVKRFNPNLGVRLVSFAVHWIKSEIHEFILKNWRIVKIATTKAQRKLFFNLRNLKKRLGWFTNEEINEVAKDLKVKPETVREMELRLNSHDAAFDGYDSDDDDHMSFTPAGFLEDHRYNPETQFEDVNHADHMHHTLHDALNQLDERSQEILQARWLNDDKSTLHALAEKYNVSAERIRQLEKNAMMKLKELMQEVA